MNVSRQTWLSLAASRPAWLSLAATAGVISFIVLAVMLGLYARPMGEDPLDTGEWTTLKTELAGRPTDQAATNRIRHLDLELRRAYFTRRDRIRLGGTLLLVGLVIGLVAIKRANRRTLPEVDQLAEPIPEDEKDRRTTESKWAVAVTGLLLLSGTAYLWVVVPAGIGLAGEEPPTGDPVEVADGPPTVEELARQWPSFRGHEGSGIAPPGEYPLTWDGTTDQNILWKTAIPRPGANSPVVGG